MALFALIQDPSPEANKNNALAKAILLQTYLVHAFPHQACDSTLSSIAVQVGGSLQQPLCRSAEGLLQHRRCS